MPVVTITTILTLLNSAFNGIDEVKDNDENILDLRRTLKMNKEVFMALSHALRNETVGQEVLQELEEVLTRTEETIQKYRQAPITKWFYRDWYKKKMRRLRQGITECMATLGVVTVYHLYRRVPEFKEDPAIVEHDFTSASESSDLNFSDRLTLIQAQYMSEWRSQIKTDAEEFIIQVQEVIRETTDPTEIKELEQLIIETNGPAQLEQKT